MLSLYRFSFIRDSYTYVYYIRRVYIYTGMYITFKPSAAEADGFCSDAATWLCYYHILLLCHNIVCSAFYACLCDENHRDCGRLRNDDDERRRGFCDRKTKSCYNIDCSRQYMYILQVKYSIITVNTKMRIAYI